MIVTAQMIATVVKHQIGCDVVLAGRRDAPVEHIKLLQGSPRAFATLYIAVEGQSVVSGDAPCLRVCGASTDRALEYAFEAYARLRTWDDDLATALERDAPLEELMAIGRRMIERPFALLSRELLVIAASSDFARGESAVGGEEGYQLPMPYVGAMVKDDDYYESMKLRSPYFFPLSDRVATDFSINIFLRDVYFGRLVVDIAGVDEIDAGQQRIVEHFAGYASEAYLRFSGNEVTSLRQNDVVHALARDLIEGRPVPREDVIADALSAYGWKPADAYTVIELGFTEQGKWEIASLYIAYVLEKRWSDTCAVISGQSIVWIVNEGPAGSYEGKACSASLRKGRSMSRIPEEALDELAEGHACFVGISDRFFRFESLNAYRRQADLAIRMGRLRHPRFARHAFSDYEFDYILEQVTREFTADQLCHAGLLRLRDYDRDHGTAYYRCLRTYIVGGRNATHAAQALFVHRSTLLRWLDKIYELTEIDLNDEEELLYVLLSFSLMDRAEA